MKTAEGKEGRRSPLSRSAAPLASLVHPFQFEAMCHALVPRAPLATVEEARAMADLWARAFAEVDDDLRWMVILARAAGLGGTEADDAEDATGVPVGESDASRMRSMGIREDAATALATLLREAGHRSPMLEEWAGPGADERRVRPRLE